MCLEEGRRHDHAVQSCCKICLFLSPLSQYSASIAILPGHGVTIPLHSHQVPIPEECSKRRPPPPVWQTPYNNSFVELPRSYDNAVPWWGHYFSLYKLLEQPIPWHKAPSWIGDLNRQEHPRNLSDIFINFNPLKKLNFKLFGMPPSWHTYLLRTATSEWTVERLNFCTQCRVQVSDLHIWHQSSTSTSSSAGYGYEEVIPAENNSPKGLY